MSIFDEGEANTLMIERMIFHVVGKELNDPILLEEISPPEHTDFFLERVRSALKGNLFSFREISRTEQTLRSVMAAPATFAAGSKALAADFQSRHSGAMSTGVFFVFWLRTANGRDVFALIKYDNEDVVRYVLQDGAGGGVPKLERFRETFVRKAEAMQKIALVHLEDQGGKLMVRDRSKPAHISEYFEGFLGAKRVNDPKEMSQKVVEAFVEAFKKHRSALPEDVRKGGVNRLYEIFRRDGQRYDSENPGALITAALGPHDEDSPIRKTLEREMKSRGIADETFDIQPDSVKKPTRKRLRTEEGVEILYDEENKPQRRPLADGRTELVIVTAGVAEDDVFDAKGARGG